LKDETGEEGGDEEKDEYREGDGDKEMEMRGGREMGR
jgi:hypothetical protein